DAHPAGRRRVADLRGQAAGTRHGDPAAQPGFQLRGILRQQPAGSLRDLAGGLHRGRLDSVHAPRLGRARLVPDGPDHPGLGPEQAAALSQLRSRLLGTQGSRRIHGARRTPLAPPVKIAPAKARRQKVSDSELGILAGGILNPKGRLGMAKARRELILAGDIGGTKTNLALFSVAGEKLRVETERTFQSSRYSGLTPILKEFGDGGRAADAACFGIAGPVVDGRVKTTNLPWIVDTAELRRALKIDAVYLLNDLEASAYGIFTLEDDELDTLNEGAPRHGGNQALIAAGTGLGEAMLYDDGRRLHPIASEGGHADFAPRDELEIELLRHLRGRFGHVSYERVLSGPGLVNIYRFLKEGRGMEEPPWLAERFAAGDDPGAVVS